MRWMLAAVAAMGLAGGAMAQQAVAPAVTQEESDAIVQRAEEAVREMQRRFAGQQTQLLGSLLAGQEHAVLCRPALIDALPVVALRAQIITRVSELVRAHPTAAAPFEESYAFHRDLYARPPVEAACRAAINSLGIAANYLRPLN